MNDELPPLRTAIEAVLLVVDEPVAEVTLAQVVERPTEEVSTVLRELAAEYDDGGRGFELRQVSGGWRLYTRSSCAPYVERFVRDGQQARLTPAALETLAVVAYSPHSGSAGEMAKRMIADLDAGRGKATLEELRAASTAQPSSH